MEKSSEGIEEIFHTGFSLIRAEENFRDALEHWYCRDLIPEGLLVIYKVYKHNNKIIIVKDIPDK